MSDAGVLREDPTIRKSRNTAQGGRPHAMNAELKPGYKQTEVGVIPEDWEVRPLGSFAQLKNGYAFKSSTYTALGRFNVLTIANVQDGFMDIAECNRISDLPRDIQPHHRLQLGDVLISMTDNVGRVCRVTTANCLLNQRVGKLVPSGVDAAFLFLLLGQRRFLTAMSGKAKGGAQGNLSVSDIIDFQFPLPPTKAEQEAIAGALSDAYALIQSLEQLLAKKRQFKQGAMQELLTGKKRLPGFSEEWEVKRLGDVADTDPENLGGDTRPDFCFNYIALEDVDVGTLRSYSEQVFQTAPSRARRKLRRDDVLVSTVRPNLMSHMLFSADGDNWVCSTGFCVVRCREGVSHPGYVYFHMFAACAGRQFDALLTGSNYPAINGGDVRALQIPFPEYEEQTAIATILSDMDAEIVALETKLAKAHALKQGMMQELLTGRIRLI